MTTRTTPSNLVNQHCSECKPGTPPLSGDSVTELLRGVPDWSLRDGKLTRNITLRNFREALALVNRIGDLAEEQGHHPDLCLHSWNQVRVDLITHSIRGLSQNDFILAAKIDQLPLEPIP